MLGTQHAMSFLLLRLHYQFWVKCTQQKQAGNLVLMPVLGDGIFKSRLSQERLKLPDWVPALSGFFLLALTFSASGHFNVKTLARRRSLDIGPGPSELSQRSLLSVSYLISGFLA